MNYRKLNSIFITKEEQFLITLESDVYKTFSHQIRNLMNESKKCCNNSFENQTASEMRIIPMLAL